MTEYTGMTLGQLEDLYEGKMNLYVSIMERSESLYGQLLEKLCEEQCMADDLAGLIIKINNKKGELK